MKKRLQCEGHECVVLNIGTSRRIPSPEYETVLNVSDAKMALFDYIEVFYTSAGVIRHSASPAAFERRAAA